MVDKHLMDQMESILSRLSIPVMLADKDPEAQMTGNELPLEQITDGLIQPVRGMLYLGVNQPAVVLYCEENLPGARDVLTLAESLVTTLGQRAAAGKRMPLTSIAGHCGANWSVRSWKRWPMNISCRRS